MPEIIDPERRITEVEAILEHQELATTYAGKEFALVRARGFHQAYMLYRDGKFPRQSGSDEPEPAVVFKLPSLVVYLDEMLNIVKQEGSGTPLSQTSVYTIIDRMLEEQAERSLKS